MKTTTLWLALTLGTLVGATTACEQDTGDKIEDAVEDAGDAVGDAAEDAADAVEDATTNRE